MNSSNRNRPAARLALFEQGFRPLFLGAALFAGIALPAWVAAFEGGATWPTHLAPLDWHMHEMIFGYFGCVLGGFILTAIPNWTSRLPVRGWPLGGLVGLWLAGRIAMATSAGWPLIAAIVDVSYLLTLSFVIWRELVASRNAKNVPVGVLVALVALANVGFHAAALAEADVSPYVRAALSVAALLISLIGGRIVPSFTRNWLVKQGSESLPASFGLYDRLTLGVLAFTLACWTVIPDARVTAGSFCLAAVLQAIRIARWRFARTLREPLLSILHVGLFWLVAWLALQAVSILAPDALDPSTALHALTAGAIGTMTLAVMTRAILGHTGRALTAGPGTIAIYSLVNAGALLRVAVPYLGYDRGEMLSLSGLLWAAAFLLFAALYAPMMLAPRVVRS
jgi:uncharacterized protein involved in response to NO